MATADRGPCYSLKMRDKFFFYYNKIQNLQHYSTLGPNQKSLQLLAVWCFDYECFAYLLGADASDEDDFAKTTQNRGVKK